MKERPILMAAEPVRNILAGRQTQDRRPVKPQPDTNEVRFDAVDRIWYSEGGLWQKQCPYGQPGDRLVVRETLRCTEHCQTVYDADGAFVYNNGGIPYWWGNNNKIPSIHMPRWASRITLEITGVRVERLQDISEEDAIAEGIEQHQDSGYWKDYLGLSKGFRDPIASFQSLWESCYGPGSWESNPWVWTISFKRVESEVRK